MASRWRGRVRPAEPAEGHRQLAVARTEAVGAYTLLVLRNDGGPVGSGSGWTRSELRVIASIS